ncbi:MAG: nucleotide sugar dehydrogenase [Hyphomicrobiaceae bacterium]|nr:nucleotide sugar dehydrogenase [Hyphomicrobiaceae bacterium]
MTDPDTQPGPGPAAADALVGRIARRDVVVGVVGLGYVGLPLAMTAIAAGFEVIGFDVNPARVALLNEGESGIEHIPGAPIAEAVRRGLFRATADLAELGRPDAILIAVPTPLSRQREPDLTFVETSTRAVARTLRRGQLVVLESTTWPGTTREVMKPILESSGLVCGADVFLAYSPEREDPGNAAFGTARIPKVVGADDAASLTIARALYDQLVVQTVPVSSAATAEAVKLTENIFRAVNIALVNELKLIFEKMDIDVWEVIEAARSKPFGYMPFYPGPGLGGHCIPIDPFYLTWKAREHDVTTRFIELAGQINTGMPYHVVDRLIAALDRAGSRGLNGARILIIGLAYKKNVDDTRGSPSLKLIELIEARGATADFHDPHASVVPVTREYPQLAGRASVALTAAGLAAYDAVLIATDHDAVDWPALARHSRLIVDTRNACARAGVTGAHIVKA